METVSRGKLYVVATPIGNLDDITIRALEILKNSDYILAEDTRVARILLNKYEINTPTIPYTDQKHSRLIEKIMGDLCLGKSISLTSDSGTPLISDPGYKLVNELSAQGYEIVAIPGVSAVTAALSIAGLPTDKFVFIGFLPKGEKKREDIIEMYGSLETTLIIFESVHKIKDLINEVYSVLGNRKAVLVKDITKKFEDIKASDLKSLNNSVIKDKGEYTLLIGKEGI